MNGSAHPGTMALPGFLLALLAGGIVAGSPPAQADLPAPPEVARTEVDPRFSGSEKKEAPSEETEAPEDVPAVEPVHPEVARLRRELVSILTSTGNRRGSWGVLAVSLDLHDTLLALNPREPMVPASNMKLLSTAAAFHYLGPEFRYQTFLLAEGAVVEGVLDGDLVLYGTGDPTLSERFYPSETAAMDTLAAKLATSGIREVRGNLLVDGSFFRAPDLHPQWDPKDLNDAFAAPVAAVTLAENLVTVRVEPGHWVGARPSVFTTPPSAGIPMVNVATTLPQGTRSRVWLFRETPADPIGIEGEIPLGGSDVWRRLPVPDPLTFAGLQLRRALNGHGIRVRGDVVPIREPGESAVARWSSSEQWSFSPAEAVPRPPVILATLDSPPLLEILTVINKESHNLFAETVLKTLGRTVVGDGSFLGGSRAVERFLTREVGVEPTQVRVMDGSGLSAGNRASPQVLVQTLTYMNASTHRDAFLATLPEAGVRRELGRMYRTPAAGNLRAKTGTMDRVSALSGMVRTRSGERILFSLLSNDVRSEYRAKRAEDEVGIRLASLTRPLLSPEGPPLD